MARNDDGNRIPCTSTGDCTDGAGTSQSAGDLRIGSRSAARYALQFLPDTALESSGLNVQRKILPRRSAFRSLEDFAYPLPEISAIA